VLVTVSVSVLGHVSVLVCESVNVSQFAAGDGF